MTAQAHPGPHLPAHPSAQLRSPRGPAKHTATQLMRVVFYGRTAHEGGDSDADRHRQLALCRTAAAAYGGQPAAVFFDEGCRAGCPWHRRPQGRSLMPALSGPGRLAGTLAVADPWHFLPRRPAPEEISLLAQLASRQVQLIIASPDLLISTPEEYELLGTVLGPADDSPLPGTASWPRRRSQLHTRRTLPALPGHATPR